MTRLLPAVAAAAVCFAAGCGGVENDPNLAAAVEKTEATGSSAFALNVTQRLNGRLQEIDCTGAADYALKRMRLSCGEFGTFIAVESAYYSQTWSAGFLGVPPDKQWLRIRVEEGKDSPHEFAPGPLLAKLRAASLETARLGEEDVRGERTVRYRMKVSCDEADLGCTGETTDVQVWIDDEGLVRRASFEDDGADITAEFHDFGLRVEVQEPSARDVVDLDNPTLERCRGGGSPISDKHLRRALKEQGFVINDSSESEQCFLGVVAVAAGTLESSPGPADPGVGVCYVYGSAGPSAPSRVRETSGSGIPGLLLQNVACSTLARVEGPTVARLRAALETLE